MHSRPLEDRSKGLREERIAVVNQIPAAEQESILAVRPIPCDLTHPVSVGRINDSCDLDPACLEVDHEQNEVPNETSPRDRFDREEVRRCDCAPLRLQEGLPAHRPLPDGINSVLRQDALDRVPPDGESEIRERS
jgi:hypothetical protein